MKKNINLKVKIASFILALFAVVACESLEETYSEFTESGEFTYIGKADSVMTAPGFEVIRVWVALNGDPKITKGRVESSDGVVSHDFTVTRAKQGRDTISFDMDLPEGDYALNLFLMDDEGNKSISSEFGVVSYGALYQSSLVNRIPTVDASFDGTAKFVWSTPADGMLKTILTYEDEAGTLQQLEIANEDAETTVDSYKLGGKIMIESVYRPTVNAFEDFKAVAFETTFEDYELDKSLFELVGLPSDIERIDPTVPAQEKDWYNAWDGNPNTVKVFLERNAAKPAYITLDLGVTVELTKFDLIGFLPYDPVTPSDYQIWGIGDVDDINAKETTVAANEDFAAWKNESTDLGWTLLVDDSRTNSDDRRGFSKKIDNQTQVRYLRLVFIDNFHASNPDIGMNELTFRGK